MIKGSDVSTEATDITYVASKGADATHQYAVVDVCVFIFITILSDMREYTVTNYLGH